MTDMDSTRHHHLTPARSPSPHLKRPTSALKVLRVRRTDCTKRAGRLQPLSHNPELKNRHDNRPRRETIARYHHHASNTR
ncbi:hypothetical protein RHA1_ro08775 (plasmid) [Rhodococcus jostii RHA1]|uniref:Uncharacterized protein n=1 Tax=Rhodococcus jostii (strain RHA1) TaxID=101510 RepID=Q0RY17_RHOJR|nr:hypothetical protein RHA1_ro08775 [Rhodococcus jostii RHA1]